jgi:antitoxin component of MazEF toxin-antitoxin module
MRSRFVRLGNSQALMIPIEVMREHGWEVGDEVELEPMASGLAVVEVGKRKDIGNLARRFVRAHRELIERLAKL